MVLGKNRANLQISNKSYILQKLLENYPFYGDFYCILYVCSRNICLIFIKSFPSYVYFVTQLYLSVRSSPVFNCKKYISTPFLHKLSQKVHFMIFKIRYNVGKAAPGHVAEDSMADLSMQDGRPSTQHGRPLNAAWQTSQTAGPVLSSETCPTKKGKAGL